jgi:threonyl-tRNA synthetase
MIELKFPDGAIKEFNKGITGVEVAGTIASSLAKLGICIKLNGKLKDIYLPIMEGGDFEIITEKSPEFLEILRHDTAHLLASAVKELFPNTEVVIGPVIENGFYYDFAREKPFTADDLTSIEVKMAEIASRKEEVRRSVLQREDAIKFFKEQGEKYKAEIINDIPSGEEVSLYKQGKFVDLCRGPHAPHTGFIKHYKLLNVSGSYFKGDPSRGNLQRIYGTAWRTKEELQKYLLMLEEAGKRDHRKLGTELELFHISDVAIGSVFWHPKGWQLFLSLQDYMREKFLQNGYQEVKTPIILNQELWEKSGHWEKFHDNMFISKSEKHTFAIKPMNCPAHIEIFKQGVKSYRDLPFRMAEFGSCHRNESSGSLHGIMRVRGFTQDDAHIFCTEAQITNETINFCKLLMEVYADFGFKDIKIKFSDRPQKRAGTDEVWDRAENSLKDAITKAGYSFVLNKGEGAFYGPKLEFVLIDALGRDWQCGTLQVDFVLPERLDATYIAENGEKTRPVVLHRAIFGSLERFIGILIENFAGKFPLWLSPTQGVICGITNAQDEYAKHIYETLKTNGFRFELDLESDKINYKIRKYSLQKLPYIVIVGEEEKANSTVSIRKLGSNDATSVSLNDFISHIRHLVHSKSHNL